MKMGLFIERDAMLNLAILRGQQKTPIVVEQFRVDEGVLAPMQRLKAAGFLIIATTNQPELSRGNLNRREMDLMHECLRAQLPFDDILVCPHEESDHCPCRKPQPGLIYEAAFKWHIDPGHSYVISHRWQDSEVARVVGATSVMINSPWLGRGHYGLVQPDFAAAADKVLELSKPRSKVA
jgi:D-glycero-D-manno-heptose 1,7-bisphosphate phosphatase